MAQGLSLSCCPGVYLCPWGHGVGAEEQVTTAPPLWGSWDPDSLPSPVEPCCYLGLGVDEQNSMPVDGNEDDIRVGGLRGLLGMSVVLTTHPGRPGCLS